MRRALPFVLASLAAACAAPELPPRGGLAELDEALPEPTDDECAWSLERLLEAAAGFVGQRETPGALEHAIALLRHGWTRDPESAALHLRLAEAHARIVDSCDLKKPGTAPRHRRHREAGRAHAREAVRLAPESGPARYWQGVLLLHAADGERSYARLKEAILELTSADKTDAECDEGGPSRMLGRVYQETPGWPLLGSPEKAVVWFRRSLAIAPARLEARFWLAQVLVRTNKRDAARAELERVLSSPPRLGREREDGAAIDGARALLKTLQ